MTVLSPPLRRPPHLVVPAAAVPAARWWSVGAWWRRAELVALALLAYVPLLLVRPGIETADTKTYLYLDPGRFLRSVASMWDPQVALGTVTHEYVGYLLPMGPFFWLASVLHLPVWAAQRLWLGSILFAAGAGVVYLARVLGLRGPGRVVGALAYMLAPYFLQYAGRISVILLPWAGLPFLVAFAVLALRKGGWRYPALFALVVALISGINASSVLYAGVAPVLWLVYAVVVEKEATWRRAAATVGRLGLLSLVVSLWWITGLALEARYGINVLKFTETVPATSQTGSAAEVLRGLGYWYFYGGDKLGPWTHSVVLYTQWLWLVGLSFLVPALAVAAAVAIRWRHRAYFVLLVVVGTALSVGAHPFDHPTPLGGLLKRFMTDTTAGLAMRSTDRATPLVLLGLALLLGAGVSALWRQLPLVGTVAAIVVAGLVVANNPAIFTGDAEVASGFTQPATLPAPERQAAAHLNAVHLGTRVLELPGQDFNVKRWGDTVDPEMAALLSDQRPFVVHEQQVMGSHATADMLFAIDEPIQEGTEQWAALAPLARLASVGDVLVQYDTQYERYPTPDPQVVAAQLATTPPGLSDPRPYGQPVENVPSVPMLDEATMALPANPAPPAPLVSYTVPDPRPVVRGESDTGALIVAGDATGLAHLAAAGLLSTKAAIYDAGTLDRYPAQLKALLRQGAALVVTDTARKQAFRWDTLVSQAGYTETVHEDPARTDLSDSPIDLFPGAPASARTVTYDLGAAAVSASSYGNPVSYTPENRPYAALDANPDTAWETGIFEPDPAGEWWQVQLAAPVTADHVDLTQTLSGDLDRSVTKVTLTFDGRHPVDATLGPASRMAGGQQISFGRRTFRTLRITIRATTDDHEPSSAASEVGFSSVDIPGVKVTEVTRMPSDLLAAAGAASSANRLTLVMTRQRVAPTPPRSDPEPSMTRSFTLPTARTFSLSGQASLSSLIPDDMIDHLVGRSTSAGPVPVVAAYSSGRLPGDFRAGASATLDGDPSTAWEPGFGPVQKGAWLQYVLGRPITLTHLDLSVVADGRHSVPTSVTVTSGSTSESIPLPPIADGRVPGSVTTVHLDVPSVTGQNFRLSFPTIRAETTSNFYAPSDLEAPIAIAEVGLPGLATGPPPASVSTGCQSDLVKIDGQPVPIQISGPSSTALNGGELAVRPCGPAAAGVALGAGTHLLQTSLGHLTGWQLDQLVLDSAPGGGPAAAPGSVTTMAATVPGPAPRVSVTGQTPTVLDAQVRGATRPFELVLGQSQNAGWDAVASPAPGAARGSHPVDLGRPQLVDGFANGWPVSAAQLAALGATGTGSFTVVMRWTPQTALWIALAVSGVGIVLCLVLVAVPPGRLAWRRRRRAAEAGAVAETNGHAEFRGPLTGVTPSLGSPLTSEGRRPRWWAVVVAAVVTGGVAAALTAPLVGAAIALATAAGLVLRRARAVTSLVAVGLVVACGAVVVHGQATHPAPAGSTWPDAWESAATLAWMGVVFLGADAVVETGRGLAARRRPRRRPRHAAGVTDDGVASAEEPGGAGPSAAPGPSGEASPPPADAFSHPVTDLVGLAEALPPPDRLSDDDPPGLSTDIAPGPGGDPPQLETGEPQPEPYESGQSQPGQPQPEHSERGPAETGPAETGPAETGPAETGPAETGPARATDTEPPVAAGASNERSDTDGPDTPAAPPEPESTAPGGETAGPGPGEVGDRVDP
jgi:hypothetical protein